MQVFNRGGFSLGHLDSNENLNLIFKEKPNNMGLPIGTVLNYNKNKGHITLNSNEPLSIGDTIMVQNENTKYTISELMVNSINRSTVHENTTVKIGRMKGNISINDKLYKLSSREISTVSENSINKENKKVGLYAHVTIAKGLPIALTVFNTEKSNDLYRDLNFTICSDICPEIAINSPITKERILSQLNKTGNTFIRFEKIEIDLEPNLFFNISTLNELRRRAIDHIINFIREKSTRKLTVPLKFNENHTIKSKVKKEVSLLLNYISLDEDYSNLKYVNCLYIPLHYFFKSNYRSILSNLCSNFAVYIYMPLICKEHYYNAIMSKLDEIISTYNINGFIVSNLGQISLVSKYGLKLIANYSLNVSNSYSVSFLGKLGINAFTLSPEFEKNANLNLLKQCSLERELIVYGRIPLMNTNYCLLGKSNKCYNNCQKLCTSGKQFYIKDRLGISFPIVPNSINTVTTIYNSKILSISSSDFNVDRVRIDILDENIANIQNIIDTVRSGNKFEGKDYTNGNLNREI